VSPDQDSSAPATPTITVPDEPVEIAQTAVPAAVPAEPWAVPRGLIVLLGLAGLVITVGGLRAFQGLAAPILFSLMIAVAVAPLQQLLMRHMKSWLASLLTLVLVYVTLLGLIGVILVSVARLATLLPTYADKAQNLQDNVKDQLTSWGVGADQFQKLSENLDFSKLLSLFESILSSTLGLVSSLTLIVTLLFFMVVDAASFPTRAGESKKLRPDLVSALMTFVWGTQRYLIVATIFGAIVAVLDTAALYALGIPLAILWGLLSFITNYIPNIGFIIGLIPPAFIGLLEGGWTMMLQVVLIYCVINVTLQTFIQPRVVGDAVGLAPSLTFIAMLFWTWVLGPLGALLAIPMTLLGKALLVDLDPAAKWALPFIGSGPTNDAEKGKAEPVESSASLEAQPPAEGSPAPA
jgi:predicted PurR-regulated permease PerM